MKYFFMLMSVVSLLASTEVFASNFSCAAWCNYNAVADFKSQNGQNTTGYGEVLTKRVFGQDPTLETAVSILETKCDTLAKGLAAKDKGKTEVSNQGTENEFKTIFTGENEWDLGDPGDGTKEFSPITDCLVVP